MKPFGVLVLETGDGIRLAFVGGDLKPDWRDQVDFGAGKGLGDLITFPIPRCDIAEDGAFKVAEVDVFVVALIMCQNVFTEICTKFNEFISPLQFDIKCLYK